jgi:hypothetical protein
MIQNEETMNEIQQNMNAQIHRNSSWNKFTPNKQIILETDTFEEKEVPVEWIDLVKPSKQIEL